MDTNTLIRLILSDPLLTMAEAEALARRIRNKSAKRNSHKPWKASKRFMEPSFPPGNQQQLQRPSGKAF